MSEEIVKAVGFLRKNGGYSLTASPLSDGGFVVTGFFKDTGSYGTTVSICAAGETIEAAQNSCIVELAKLVHYTAASKPSTAKDVVRASPTSPASNAIISLKGLDDSAWGKAKDLVKSAGFRYDKESKNWIGGDVNSLPDWLKKRNKNGSSSYSKPAAKPAPMVEAEPEAEAESDDSFISDDMPF